MRVRLRRKADRLLFNIKSRDFSLSNIPPATMPAKTSQYQPHWLNVVLTLSSCGKICSLLEILEEALL